MAKNDQQTSLEENKPVGQPEETASKKPELKYDDNDPVTVVQNGWWYTGRIARKKDHWFDKYHFQGGIGHRVRYKDAKEWKQQGHGIEIFDVDATEEDFIKRFKNKPLDDELLKMQLRAMSPEKIAAILGPENLDKISAIHKRS